MNYSRSIGKETPTFLLKGSREGLIKKRGFGLSREG